MAERAVPPVLPRILRARGFHLYDAAGRRYLDLWQAGGDAFLGHRPPGVTAAVKAALSRGLASGLPSAAGARLVAVLTSLLPACRSFRLYPNRDRALAAASRWLGRELGDRDLADPALGQRASAAAVALWRPGLPPAEPGGSGARIVLPVLPWTLGGAPAALGFTEELPGDAAPSEPVAVAALAGALRGLSELARGRPDPFGADELAGTNGWERRGPYVAPAFGLEAWPGVFAAFLASGLLLPPAYPGPAILPGEASPGERRLVVSLFRTFGGG